MIRELLLALAGHTGDTIQCIREEEENVLIGFTVHPRRIIPTNNKLTNGHAATSTLSGLMVSGEDAQLMNRVLKTGFYYHEIAHFVQLIRGAGSLANTPPQYGGTMVQTMSPAVSRPVTGIYINALCNAIDAVCLQPYRRFLTDIERDILAQYQRGDGDEVEEGTATTTTTTGTYPLSKLVYLMKPKWQPVFEHLMYLTDEILDTRLAGGQIIDAVYKSSLSGIPPVRETFCNCCMLFKRYFAIK